MLDNLKIMVVDDTISNLKMAKNALEGMGDIFTVPSAKLMFELLPKIIPSLILLDINMPDMTGLEAIAHLKLKEQTRRIPVIFLTSRSDPGAELAGLSLGAVDYITKPFEPVVLRKRVEIHLTILAQRVSLEKQGEELRHFNEKLKLMVREETEKAMKLQSSVLNTVVDMVEGRDDITGGHISRTMNWLRCLIEGTLQEGTYRKITAGWDIDLFLQSSRLHDVGKISINDSILKKPGPLDTNEFETMKMHTLIGAQIIDKIISGLPNSNENFLTHAKVLALSHHEKWDGGGYPLGLAGEDIPLQGRIMAIADVYDALISKRPYKKPLTHEEAVEIIVEGSGRHFDPILVLIFEQVCHQFRDFQLLSENSLDGDYSEEDEYFGTISEFDYL
jgi:putative two-component system response regulator